MNLFKWIISDSHLWHQNIVKYCNRPGNKQGDYYYHNELIINNWHRLIQPNDTVLHLGDVCMWNQTRAVQKQILTALPGRKYLLPGNHDKKLKQFEDCGFEIITKEIMLKCEGYVLLLTHEPVYELGKHELNIHGHIHDKPSPSIKHENVCVEQTKYEPVLLTSVAKRMLRRVAQA